MHENEFEKRVQQKMEELQFVPSDAVWKNVDKEINKKEKRRPVFWLFLFLGLLLIGGGVYFFANNHSVKADKLSKIDKVDKLNGLKGEESVEKVEKLRSEKEIEKFSEDKNETIAKADENEKRKNDDLNDLKADAKVNRLSALKSSERKKNSQNDEAVNSISLRKEKSKSFDKRNKEIDVKENKVFENGSKNNDDENAVSKNSVEGNIITKEIKKVIQDSSDNKTASAVPDSKKNNVANNKINPADSLSEKKIAKNNIKSKKSSAWKIGVHFVPGISSVQRGLFKSTTVSDPAAYSSNNASNGPSGGNALAVSSEIKSSYSFGFGVSVNKAISKRLSFTTGIDYHYYSTSISSGKFIDSSVMVYPYNNSNSLSLTNGYYSSGNNKYTNSYHFLELPLLLDWQINKGNKIPFIWEAGASVAYLINSDALHFDPVKNIYYKNSSLFNKAQINISTSFMANFHLNKNELMVGPQLQYGATRLLKSSTGNTEHLLFAGIKFAYIFNKK